MADIGTIVLLTLQLPGVPKVRPAVVTSNDDPRGHGLSVWMDGTRDWDQEMRGDLIAEGMTFSGMATGHVFAKEGGGPGTWAALPSAIPANEIATILQE